MFVKCDKFITMFEKQITGPEEGKSRPRLYVIFLKIHLIILPFMFMYPKRSLTFEISD
jgi:hypothetical protein